MSTAETAAPLPSFRAVADRNILFWYTKGQILLVLAFMFCLVESVSWLIPPFQSPDEFNHFKRAYLLSKGEVFLGTKGGQTGGNIDAGLLDYMQYFEKFPFKYEKRVETPNARELQKLGWAGKRRFSELANTAAYFPLPYTPQALACLVGERTGLSVSETYYLARLLSLVATLVLIYFTFILYPTPPFVLALFLTPMTLFQLSSASLDAVTFGLSALVAALFMRGTDGRFSFSTPMHISLTLGTLLLAASRVYFVPLTLLPAVLYWNRRSRVCWVSASISFLVSVSWTLFALTAVHGNLAERGASTAEIASYYLRHPLSLIHVLFSTVTSGEVMTGYWAMFVGILGWIDTPLDFYIYYLFGLLFLALVVVSFEREKALVLSLGHLSLTAAGGLSVLLLFLVCLLAWTSHPAEVVEAIQGRYFTPILILLGFSIFGRALPLAHKRVALVVLFSMTALSITSMVPKLINRYWIATSAPDAGYYSFQKP